MKIGRRETVEGKYRSYFAVNWRKYLDPETPQYKWAMREFARIKKGIETARYQKIINRNIRKVEG